MEQNKWVNYWKKSLSDSLAIDLDVNRFANFEIVNFQVENSTIFHLQEVNHLINLAEERANNSRGVSDKESENWIRLAYAEIFIAPFKLNPIPERLVFLQDRNAKLPFWYRAVINRQGRLSVPEEVIPAFQRKFLDPVADEKTEFIFSSVEKVDKAVSTGKEEYESYGEYIQYIQNAFSSAVDQPLDSYEAEGYNTIHNGILLLPNDEATVSTYIIHLYEKILKEKQALPLLSDFISSDHKAGKEPLATPELIDVNALHAGQMGYSFPLSVSQRRSLYTLLQTNSKVFAVNGPPGTGKTTLIQSIVASRIVDSAIKGDNPPVILACSNNNQAVTNIIDSFSRSNTRDGSLQGRWIPDVDGYATFLASERFTEKELDGINYKKAKGEGFFTRVENVSYLERAKSYFLQKASAHFYTHVLDVDGAIGKLRNEIKAIQSTLQVAALKWKNYLTKEKVFLASYCNEAEQQAKYYADHILNEKQFETDVTALIGLERNIVKYFKTEPVFRKLFCFFGIQKSLRNRAADLRIILRNSLIKETSTFKFTRADILESIHNKVTLAQDILKGITEWKDWKQHNGIRGNPPKTTEEYWNFELSKIEGERSGNHEMAKPNCFYDELDVTLRHKAFQLALHYWEGRWLIQYNQDKFSDAGKQNKEAVENRWLRHAMLTPCFVSTFYMAPKFFTHFKYLGTFENGRLIPNSLPLFNYIDLLIVDEAGQVSPEVGVATFSLARQAVVVGDVMQIEPIWNVSRKVDIGNLKREGIIRSYDDTAYESFDEKGFLASTGSIMKMAQHACHFRENNSAEKGIMLTEHRRCFDEIINCCNDLAYKGKLKPLKGKARADNLFPPMHGIHVEGSSSRFNTSRFNEDEVSAVITWLRVNKTKIEARYGKLENAVGIITPFVGQKVKLRQALRNNSFDTSLMKIGTVHALQGAERPIILLSTVYGSEDAGTMFFDRDNKPNMLNVAVSRAKDSFIVFGNARIFNKKHSTPSGILANHIEFQHIH